MVAGGEPVERWERHAGAASAPLGRYRRREPEKTLLHAVVRERLEPFLAVAERNGKGLPAHVERALRAYLDCGILARGFARVRCPDCGFERLVAFSCKGQVCSSCATRRMEDSALHLIRDVFPAVPVRQWVLSFPRRLRFQAARSTALTSRLLEVFTRAVFAWQRRVARRTGVADPRTGGVTFVQRFGGALNLNVHFHTLVPDGVFEASGDGPARFVRLKAPRDEEVEAILARVIRRVQKLMPDDEGADLPLEDDAYAALQAAEVDRRLAFPDPFRHGRRAAHLDGFSLHAGVRIHENDRQGLERLCRYAARPPLVLHRLSAAPGGRLVYRMKRPRGGSLFLLLTPDQLLAKLATLVPPPRSHALRYHGVFGPSSRVRSRVVPASPAPLPVEAVEAGGSERQLAQPPPVPSSSPSPPPTTASAHQSPFHHPARGRSHRTPWAELLQKVFAVDVLACPECGGRLEVLAFISQPSIAKQILNHLGLSAQAPPVTSAPRDDVPAEAAPEYDCVDPVYGE